MIQQQRNTTIRLLLYVVSFLLVTLSLMFLLLAGSLDTGTVQKLSTALHI